DFRVWPRDGFGKSARAHSGIGEIRCGKPRHAIGVAAKAILADAAVADVAIDETELAVDVFALASLPSVAKTHDFIMVTADEIPPHQDFFPQWFAADKERASCLIRVIANTQGGLTNTGVADLGFLDFHAFDQDGASICNDAMFKIWIKLQDNLRE